MKVNNEKLKLKVGKKPEASKSDKCSPKDEIIRENYIAKVSKTKNRSV